MSRMYPPYVGLYIFKVLLCNMYISFIVNLHYKSFSNFKKLFIFIYSCRHTAIERIIYALDCMSVCLPV